MKKILFIILPLLSFAIISIAQVGFVDTKYVLNKMPEYQEAQKQLDQLSIQWQREIDNGQAVLNKMNIDYEGEQAMLSDDIKKKRQDEISNKEKQVRDLQRKHFGFDGDLFTKREELVNPIKDRVNNAVQRIAVSLNYKIILDKSEGITVMFSDKKLDITENVIRELGIK